MRGKKKRPIWARRPVPLHWPGRQRPPEPPPPPTMNGPAWDCYQALTRLGGTGTTRQIWKEIIRDARERKLARKYNWTPHTLYQWLLRWERATPPLVVRDGHYYPGGRGRPMVIFKQTSREHYERAQLELEREA